MKSSKMSKVLGGLLLLLLILGGVAYYCYHRIVLSPNYNVAGVEPIRFNIYPGDKWGDILAKLDKEVPSRYGEDLRRLISLKEYPPRYGSYLILPDMSTLSLYRAFIRGRETAIKLRFNSVRTPQDLYEVIGGQLMIGADGVRNAMTDSILLAQEGLSASTFTYSVVPNTYEVYWSISAEELVKRLSKEVRRFWDEERSKKAETIGLSPYDVSVLASIVQEESAKVDEYDDIAGLYLNRLRINMPLQADPTVKYAVGDFSLRRILHEHLKTPSPYNTYLVTGLPPSPIRIPSIQAIDGVLNAAQHDYLYMCAKEDFSGYHNFAVSYNEHLMNARRYAKALNDRGIK